ncbi:variable large family protein [Borrelia persica]|uniref:variable large family protein n=1 Tax=Borrelia persica TaxID=44448 RepID=UPI0004667277|nr:variable large family protein [Borrelia persica]
MRDIREINVNYYKSGGIGKMKKVIKRSLIIMMILGVMGCGQQVQKPGEQDGSSGEGLKLGETTKSVFSAFVDLITNALGISVTSATKKSDVSDKFKDLASSIDRAISQVHLAVSKAGINFEEVKDGSVVQARKTLDELKKHITSLQTLTNESLVVSGVTASSASGVGGVGSSVEDVKGSLIALKGIVAANTNKGVEPKNNQKVSSDEKEGGKVLLTGGAGAAVAADAAKALSIVTSVTGEEMLYAISSADEADVSIAANINTATDPKHAVKLAVTGTATTAADAQNASKVALAGGIALRSLLKGGKLDANAAAADTMAVNGVGVSAANKLLRAIENIAQVIIKQCLEQIEQILGDGKSKIVKE